MLVLKEEEEEERQLKFGAEFRAQGLGLRARFLPRCHSFIIYFQFQKPQLHGNKQSLLLATERIHSVHHSSIPPTSSQQSNHYLSLDIRIQVQPDPGLEVQSDPDLQALLPFILVACCRKRFAIAIDWSVSFCRRRLVVTALVGLAAVAVPATSPTGAGAGAGWSRVVRGQARGGARRWVSVEWWCERDIGSKRQKQETGEIPEHCIGHLYEVKAYCNGHGGKGLGARFIADRLSRDEQGRRRRRPYGVQMASDRG